MQVGCLGDIVFEVSDSTVKTLRQLEFSGSASIQSHDRHCQKAIPEFTGVDLESMSFSVRVTKVLGADPTKDIEKIREYMNNGKTLPFTLGTKTLGYRWLISQYKVICENFDAKANIIDADISITLKEYPRSD